MGCVHKGKGVYFKELAHALKEADQSDVHRVVCAAGAQAECTVSHSTACSAREGPGEASAERRGLWSW